MAQLKSKSLFFTTSPRTPSKMIPEIQLIDKHFSGQKWDKQTQTQFIDCLAQSDFFEGCGSPNNKDFSARDRINRAPKALGFVDLAPHIELTDAGRAFVYGKRPQEVFLRQLLKFQLPSPYHIENALVKGTFFVKPYLEIMRLIRDLEYLSFDELKIFALMLTDYRKYDAIKDAIISFRSEKETHRGQYKRLVEEKWTSALLYIYADIIRAGRTKTRETADKSLKTFLSTKKSNARDYADACFRYLRYTGLVSISHKNHSIAFYPDKLKDVDYILTSISRDPVFIDDTRQYKDYLFDAATPTLYVDSIKNVTDHLMHISDYTQRQLSGKSIEELKDLRDAIVADRKEAVIKAQVTEIKSYALYSEIIDTYNEIISDGYYDAPLMLEYNTWRAMTMLDGGIIKGNFKFDDMGQPLSTASGNMPDIECDYDDYVLSVEVTMQQGQRQYESESEPVARHLGQMKKRTGKDAYCLFIAPNINHASLAYFFALNKIGVSFYGGKTKIIPLDLDLFMRLVENSYNYPSQPSPHDIRQFLDEVMRQEELAADENDWKDRIQHCVAQWLAA